MKTRVEQDPDRSRAAAIRRSGAEVGGDIPAAHSSHRRAMPDISARVLETPARSGVRAHSAARARLRVALSQPLRQLIERAVGNISPGILDSFS